MRVFLFILAIVGSIAGALIILWMFQCCTDNVMQMSTGFALACAVSILPYVIARSYQEIVRS